jgi:hypothetical protein
MTAVFGSLIETSIVTTTTMTTRLLGKGTQYAVHVYAVQQAAPKVSTSFWSALHYFTRHDWPVPEKGWDEVGPGHPFLSVRIQIPMRPWLVDALLP